MSVAMAKKPKGFMHAEGSIKEVGLVQDLPMEINGQDLYNEIMKGEKEITGTVHAEGWGQSRGSDTVLDEERNMPLEDLSEQLPDDLQLSTVRLAGLLKDGKIRGDLRREGRGRGKWYTSIVEVKKYKDGLLSPGDYGRKGGRPRKNH